MTDRPMVSVVVPLHNGETFIADTLTSLQQQTDRDLEVIVVDDGSTDSGAAIAAAHPVGARVIHQESRGVAVARNRGAAHARGAWLAFLDQDDLWHQDRLSRARSVLESGRHSLVLTTLRSFGWDSDRSRLRASGSLIEGMVDHWVRPGQELIDLCGPIPALDLAGSDRESVYTQDDLLRRTVSVTTSFFITREHLQLIGGWSLHARSIDDWWLMANAARLEPLLEVDQPTVLYRIHGSATSRTTQFWYPYATSLLALRFGSQVGSVEDALTQDIDNDTVRHLMAQTMDSAEYRTSPEVRSFVGAMSRLLWPEGGVRRQVRRAEADRLSRGSLRWAHRRLHEVRR